jgi:hypothetical protein
MFCISQLVLVILKVHYLIWLFLITKVEMCTCRTLQPAAWQWHLCIVRHQQKKVEQSSKFMPQRACNINLWYEQQFSCSKGHNVVQKEHIPECTQTENLYKALRNANSISALAISPGLGLFTMHCKLKMSKYFTNTTRHLCNIITCWMTWKNKWRLLRKTRIALAVCF